MNKILEFEGLDAALYPCVGPLVMNPAVLKQNYNFPFRTTQAFRWFVAVDDDEVVVGFIPVERRRSGWIINNYYIKERDNTVLVALLQRIIDVASEEKHTLVSISFLEDRDVFREQGFEEVNVWKRYVKMIKNR
ncbi:hypothetical protein [uncultured Bacteroides sp.]|uniref:hypothetical protein n=1 Tax=uncultured Bacteroides sp. TaxID=162156 RepID=UPI002633C66D|nr:hypothetical protein [uncultured Bacteroides sp.]